MQSTYARECIALVFYSLFLLLFSRAIFIAPILVAHNRWSDQKLTYSEMVIAWYPLPLLTCIMLSIQSLNALMIFQIFVSDTTLSRQDIRGKDQIL